MFVPYIDLLPSMIQKLVDRSPPTISKRYWESYLKALGENGLFFKKHEYQIFEKAFGNQAGTIGWFQFLQVIRNPLSNKRRESVENIFSYISQQYEHLNPQNIGIFLKI